MRGGHACSWPEPNCAGAGRQIGEVGGREGDARTELGDYVPPPGIDEGRAGAVAEVAGGWAGSGVSGWECGGSRWG